MHVICYSTNSSCVPSYFTTVLQHLSSQMWIRVWHGLIRKSYAEHDKARHNHGNVMYDGYIVCTSKKAPENKDNSFCGGPISYKIDKHVICEPFTYSVITPNTPGPLTCHIVPCRWLILTYIPYDALFYSILKSPKCIWSHSMRALLSPDPLFSGLGKPCLFTCIRQFASSILQSPFWFYDDIESFIFFQRRARQHSQPKYYIP